MERVVLRAASVGSLPVTLAMCWTAGVFIVLSAVLLVWLSDGDNERVSAFAIGLGLYGLALAIHGTFFFVRVFRRARLNAPMLPKKPLQGTRRKRRAPERRR